MSDEAIKYLQDRARDIVRNAETRKRGLTDDERTEVEGLLKQLDHWKADKAYREGRYEDIPDDIKTDMLRRRAEDKAMTDLMDGVGAAPPPGGTFAKAVYEAGWNLRHQPQVEVPLEAAIGRKASTFPAAENLNRLAPVIAGLGQDQRFLHPHLVGQAVEGETAVQTFRQDSPRSITGTVERGLTATTDKATLGLTLTHVVEALKMQAIIIDAVPNAILESVDTMSAFLESEGRFQINRSLDTHVLAQIVAASPPFGTTGTTLIDKIRNGVASMRATGFNPTIVVLNPTDAASLDLSADAGGYVFATRDTGTSSPLWGLRVIERIGAGSEPPYLVDPQALGVLYTGNLRVMADPYAGAGGANFKKNLTDLRFELRALFHVRQAEGARRIAAT
jgi:hypothetical protein